MNLGADDEDNWDYKWSKGGILDMDAATKPPVKFKESGNGAITDATRWTVGTSGRINWTRTFSPQVSGASLCGKLRLEAQYQDDADNWPANWNSLVSGTVNTGSGTSSGKTVTVPSLGLSSGDTRSARVRLRCDGTQLFTVSKVFTVKKN